MKSWYSQKLALDQAYKNSISQRIEREWGAIFCNESNPSFYDANHAEIMAPVTNAEEVVREVISFFESRQIIPRFYIYHPEQCADLLGSLSSRHFTFEEFEDRLLVWNGLVTIQPPDMSVEIERVITENEQAACQVISGTPELGSEDMRKIAFAAERSNPVYSHYLLRYEGEPASCACLIRSEDAISLENVATLPAFRGKGLIRHLISYMQQEVAKQGINSFFVSPINERVGRVYEKCGFEPIGETLRTAHAFRGGKSVSEIRGNS
ncbi:GNAT family N-acetyltransferase [Brevibacillus daliensis]|uniref:GNAT family N-acetyltransferase n=1 Tax=Brevibacillus daliensis TaxID=2892995 RepID=UPI001E2CB693|nr:GNAT family N-acetyltransferase [Brevibacillus daliensis]